MIGTQIPQHAAAHHKSNDRWDGAQRKKLAVMGDEHTAVEHCAWMCAGVQSVTNGRQDAPLANPVQTPMLGAPGLPVQTE
jgi:hypothetical protein